MLLGVPVLTSRSSSLIEVAGDAAVFVDPYRPAEIAEGLRRLNDDSMLRDRLSLQGPKVAERFGVEQYMERLSKMYQRVL